MNKKRVVVTGMGIVAPNGVGLKQFGEALFDGKSGIGPITHFDASNFQTKVAAEVKNFDPVDFMPVAVVRRTDKFSQLGLAAAGMALKDADFKNGDPDLTSASIIMGSGLGGLNFHEETIIAVVESGDPKKATASSVPKITPNAVSSYIALQHGIKGQNIVISTACSSGAQAIGEAFRKIRTGENSVVITGGVEAPVSLVTVACYQSMMVLGSPLNGNLQESSRPFDNTRNGFVLGEGAACLILEEYNHAVARGVKIHCEIVGFGSNCGAYHMVTPNSTGEDAKEAMNLALSDANLDLSDIDYINAHGTSTKLNDLAETKAIKQLFGKRAYKIPVSSIKSMVGHTIGAAGAIEAVASSLSIELSCIPPTINLKHPDPECDLDYVPNESRRLNIDTVMSNSFGFGSNNCVLIFKKV